MCKSNNKSTTFVIPDAQLTIINPNGQIVGWLISIGCQDSHIYGSPLISTDTSIDIASISLYSFH